MNKVRENLFRVKESIQAAALRSGREAQSVKLIVVTKHFDVEGIREVYELGERDFGENHVQELLEKTKLLPNDICWHLIGHLQTNKMKLVVGQAQWIHSVDSLKLACKLDGEGQQRNVKIHALVQCNTSREKSKFGLSPEGIHEFLGQASRFRFLDIQGFMTMAPLGAEERVLRKAFSDLRSIFENAKKFFPQFRWHHLSMGMTQDYEIAVEEGATMVRVGTAIFGERS